MEYTSPSSKSIAELHNPIIEYLQSQPSNIWINYVEIACALEAQTPLVNLALKELGDRGLLETNHCLDVRLVRNSKVELIISDRLQELENTIAQGLAVFYSVGSALLEIRTSKLYKERGYSTFAAYCEEHWGIGDRQARLHIKAVKVVENLKSGSSGSTFNEEDKMILPKTERVARELSKVKDQLQLIAWNKALEKYGDEPTAHQVKQVVDLLKPPKPSKPQPIWNVDDWVQIRLSNKCDKDILWCDRQPGIVKKIGELGVTVKIWNREVVLKPEDLIPAPDTVKLCADVPMSVIAR